MNAEDCGCGRPRARRPEIRRDHGMGQSAKLRPGFLGYRRRPGLSLTRRHHAISVKASPSSTMTAMSISQVRGLCFHSGSGLGALAAAGAATLATVPAEAFAFLLPCFFPAACWFAVGCALAAPADPLGPGDPLVPGDPPGPGEALVPGAALGPGDVPGAGLCPAFWRDLRPAGFLPLGVFGKAGSWITFRLDVDEVAAKPQRDGDSHAICSTPACPCSGNTPPVRMTWKITATISSGMVFSEVLTSAEISNPSAIEATASTPMASSSSTSGRCLRKEPCGGSGRPSSPMTTITAACSPLISPRIASFEIRYAPDDSPAARSRL